RTHLLAVDERRQAADGAEPRAEDTVAQAAGAVLVFGSFLLEEFARLGRVVAAVDGVWGPQPFPDHFLEEVLTVEEPLFKVLPAPLEQLSIEGDVVAQRLAHQDGGLERSQIKAGAHPVGAPKLDVV